MREAILQKTLAILARATIKKHQPIIIGITGSVGKTSTREAIFAVLKKKYRVRTAEKNYNNEIGLPLTILGIPHYGKNIFKWFFAFIRALLPQKSYPEILVLEYGIDRPGDMDKLLFISRPNIAVVTAIGDIPVHVEFFKDPEEVIAEKAKLVSAVLAEGKVILNYDDYAVYDMKEKAKETVLTFGFGEGAEIRASNYQIPTTKYGELGDIPAGITFKIEHGDQSALLRIKDAFGEPQVYAVAAATAVGISLGMNLTEISEAVRVYEPPPGRMRLIKGIKNSFILDDTYNAAPEAMRSALATLKNLPGKRKIAVLGDMLEIGKYAEQAHRSIGDEAASFVDLLFTVGPRSKFMAEEASSGLEGKALQKSQILRFENSNDAGEALVPAVRPGDLILVKGSQSMRMEKVVGKIMAHPENARELLVRQDEFWLRR